MFHHWTDPLFTGKQSPAIRENHEQYMGWALREAEQAAREDEVPIGALLVGPEGEILASCHNQTISRNDPTAHAEILAIREACRVVGNYRLLDTILYVTIEPCVMCMGAVIHARISGIVFGAADPRWGGCGSIYRMDVDERLNHHPAVLSGILEEECRSVIQAFFRAKR
jgi:tRNA(adenine34) deaminase